WAGNPQTARHRRLAFADAVKAAFLVVMHDEIARFLPGPQFFGVDVVDTGKLFHFHRRRRSAAFRFSVTDKIVIGTADQHGSQPEGNLDESDYVSQGSKAGIPVNIVEAVGNPRRGVARKNNRIFHEIKIKAPYDDRQQKIARAHDPGQFFRGVDYISGVE